METTWPSFLRKTKWRMVSRCLRCLPSLLSLAMLWNCLLVDYFNFNPLFLRVDDAQRYHCDYCGCDITLRLKCYVCPDFDLCLEVRVGTHFSTLTVRLLPTCILCHVHFCARVTVLCGRSWSWGPRERACLPVDSKSGGTMVWFQLPTSLYTVIWFYSTYVHVSTD